MSAAQKLEPEVPHYHGQWTARMRALKVGESFTFDLKSYPTLNGIRVRMKRFGGALRFKLSHGYCTRIE